MLTHRILAPVVPLTSSTVPRYEHEQVKKDRNMYRRLYMQDRCSLAAERADNHRLRMLVVSLGGDPGRRP